jgi:hypothetical protein
LFFLSRLVFPVWCYKKWGQGFFIFLLDFVARNLRVARKLICE